jgi:uncharacterized membrane protein YqjE
MDTRGPGASGLLGSLRGLADGLIGSAHDRLELLAIELHEEKHRLIQIFIWISAIVFLAMLAMVFASMAIVVLFWETARVAVVCSLAGIYIAALVATAQGFKRYLKRQPKPFAATLSELREDRECIRAEN